MTSLLHVGDALGMLVEGYDYKAIEVDSWEWEHNIGNKSPLFPL
jgi:hypothetical protein